MSPRSLAITLVAFALIALALRVIRLEERPPHTDEAVNAWILGRILEGEPFAFDPRDRHGPLLPAAGLAVATILGVRSFADLDERTIRLAPAIVGAAATTLFLLGHGVFPSGVLLGSAALWTASPLPLYYARYAIHETLLVASTLAFLLLLSRTAFASTSRTRLAWAAGTGVAAGLMLAAKLSALIPLAAAAVALGVAWWTASRASSLVRTSGILASATTGLLSAVLVVAFAYSWGFTRAAGLHDLAFGLDAPIARAAGEGHEKGPLYFFTVLGFGGFGTLFLVLAAIGAVVAWRRGGPIGRGLVTFAVVLIAVHSAIPYKTPWLALGLWLPLSGLAAWTLAALLTLAWQRAHAIRLAAILGLTGAAALTASADQQLVFSDPANENNPFAYAHTSPDLRRLEGLIVTLRTQDPLIAVYAEDAWPLPFLLRRQARVGYWQPGQSLPDHPDLLVTTAALSETLDARFQGWRPHFFNQRPGVMLVALQPPEPETMSTP